MKITGLLLVAAAATVAAEPSGLRGSFQGIRSLEEGDYAECCALLPGEKVDECVDCGPDGGECPCPPKEGGGGGQGSGGPGGGGQGGGGQGGGGQGGGGQGGGGQGGGGQGGGGQGGGGQGGGGGGGGGPPSEGGNGGGGGGQGGGGAGGEGGPGSGGPGKGGGRGGKPKRDDKVGKDDESRKKDAEKGRFLCCPSSDCDNLHVEVGLDFVREFGADGKPVKGGAQIEQTFTVGEAVYTTIGEPAVNATKYPFFVEIEGATITIDTYTFDGATTVVTGDTGVSIAESAVKFDISVESWSFADPANTLKVGLGLKAKGTKKEKPDFKDGPEQKGRDVGGVQTKTAKTVGMNFGEMYFISPLTAVYDGVEGSVEASSEVKDDKTVVHFEFGSFEESVVYDPAVGSSDDENAPEIAEDDVPEDESPDFSGGSAISPGLATAGLAFLAAMFR